MLLLKIKIILYTQIGIINWGVSKFWFGQKCRYWIKVGPSDTALWTKSISEQIKERGGREKETEFCVNDNLVS